ncbi:MAG TPA: copper-binding protein [Acidimicrobiia bacterium]|nr:copper-binding protein [Acidimicrobiia bacterium]
MDRLNIPALVGPVAGMAVLGLGGCAPAGHSSEAAAPRQQVTAEAATTPVLPVGHRLSTDDGSPAATIGVRRLAFTPASFTITAGQALVWSFDDGGVAHTVTGDGFDSGQKTTGLFSHTFATPGTFGYHCSVHPAMKGTVVVTSR